MKSTQKDCSVFGLYVADAMEFGRSAGAGRSRRPGLKDTSSRERNMQAGSGAIGMKARSESFRSACCAAAAAFFAIVAMSSAPVPGAADDGEEAREVVSVGSRMSTGAAKGLLPITVIEREDIELSGARNLWDFLAGRLDYNSYGLDRPFILGAFRVALLIDGRPITDTVYALDSLPVAAVERIEVLSNGAAALYGPQATAGAVNIVLRDRFEGIEVQAGIEHPVNGGGESGLASVLWGGAFGPGHLSIGVDLFRRNEIRESQRRYSRSSWTPGGAFADTTGVSVFGNTAIAFTGEGIVAQALGDCEGGAFTGPLAEPYGIPGEGCGYASGDVAWSWEQRDRDALFVGLDYPVSEDHSLYFDSRLVQSDYMFPRSAPALISLPPTRQLPATVFHRFAGHGHRDRSMDLDEYDLTLGVEGGLPYGIGFDAHLRTHSHDEFREAGTYVRRSVFEQALADGSYDLLNPLSTAPAHLEAVADSSLRLTRDRAIEHRVARVTFDGRSPEFLGRSMGWAAGAELAYEKRTRDPVYRDAAGNRVDQGDVIGSFDFGFSGDRTRLSKFVELSVPLHERWDLMLASRHDDHDDVESTKSHQLATRFRLSENLSLRGSWSKSAKPPGIGALHTARVVTRPRIYDPMTGYRYEIVAFNSGNPGLDESRADSFGLGIVSDMGPVTLSADWFRMGLSRLLTIYSSQGLLRLEAQGALPDDVLIDRDPQTNLIRNIVKPVSGDGKTDVSGLNLHARTGWQSRWADFELDVWWTHVTKYYERASGIETSYTVPRNRAHAMLRATRGDVTAQWSAYGLSSRPHYWGSSYSGWVGHDLSVRWEDAFGVAGTEIIGGVVNVADREPSTDPYDAGYSDETFDSIRGRTLFVSVEKTW